MKGSEIIKTLLKETKTTQLQLSQMLGYKGQSAVAERLKKDMRISVFAKMANALGYDIYVVKRKPGKTAVEKGVTIMLSAEEDDKKESTHHHSER